MREIARWAAVLAEQVTPEESATAALVAEAYAQGGRHRRALMEQSGAIVGGFGAGELLVLFPSVLSAVQHAAPYLLALLASRHLGDLLGAVKNALSVAELSASRGGSTRGALAAMARDAVDVSGLTRAIEVIQKTLSDNGISSIESEMMALFVVRALLRDTENGRRFIQFIAEKA
jgi:hypothetical protein